MESGNKGLFRLIIGVLICLIIVLFLFIVLVNIDNSSLKLKINDLSSNIADGYDIDSIDKEILIYKNIDDSIKNKYDEYYSNIALLEDKINKGESSVKIAYLTFDDGPYDLTYQVLDLLKSNDIRATFFVLGKDDTQEQYKRIVSEGHTLANHTYYHNIGSGLYDSADSFISQVKKLEDYLYNITGYRTSIVRFPGGSPTAGKYKDEIVDRLHEMGYNYVDWTSETGDGSSKKLAEKDTWSWYVDTTRDKDIIVLLMHDYNYSTFNNLQRIIDDLRDRGFIFLPLHNKSMMAKQQNFYYFLLLSLFFVLFSVKFIQQVMQMGLFDKFKNVFNKKDKVDVESYEKGLEKTRNEFVSKLNILNSKYKKVSQEYFDELEEILIMADIGVNTVMDFVDRLKKRVKKENIVDSKDLLEIIVDEMFIIYVNNDVIVNKINYSSDGPTVILFVGVNGVGKTTTIGKLAYKLVNEGKRVLMVAGDTFRAGAIEQINEWGERCGCPVVSSESLDPSSVIFDGITKAKEENYDVVLVDTAGRLQNKDNLMKELEKINRVIGKIIPGAPHETLLVVDATTGQNGISQAKSFKEITNITGIVLTKLDGTAKGGIVLAIKEEVGIPVKYVGLGEQKEDLRVFDIEKYIYGLFKELDENE